MRLARFSSNFLLCCHPLSPHLCVFTDVCSLVPTEPLTPPGDGNSHATYEEMHAGCESVC